MSKLKSKVIRSFYLQEVDLLKDNLSDSILSSLFRIDETFFALIFLR